MKISVVIPAFNEEKNIDKLIQSLLNQEEPADEIIVVDNNSTDHTDAIVKNYNVRILHEPKQGITHARNRGFDEAKYEIIARTDADTVLPTDWIRKIKNDFKKYKIDGLS